MTALLPWRWCAGAAIGLALIVASRAWTDPPPDVATAIETLKKVGPVGAGHLQAQAALARLSTADAGQLPVLLAALDNANPLAANWIRAAIESIAERQTRAGRAMPVEALESLLRDRSHAPRARRLAYELLLAADPSTADRWIPQLLDDPSLELRREAVARLIDEGRKQAPPVEGEKTSATPLAAVSPDAAKATFNRALKAARDLDQIRQVAEELKKLGVNTNLARQLGFFTEWWIVGPFDNHGGQGFTAIYPPEQGVELSTAYGGEKGPLRWQHVSITDELGSVDFNRELEKLKGAVAYAYLELISPERRQAQLRLSTDNAYRIWLNGKLVGDAEIYHAFTTFDQYILPVTLQAGANRIVVKICQNEQTEDWAGDWKFQLRLCDETGGNFRLEEKR